MGTPMWVPKRSPNIETKKQNKTPVNNSFNIIGLDHNNVNDS